MQDKKAAKKLLKRAKVHPSLYTEGDVKYAKMIKRKLKNAQQLEFKSKNVNFKYFFNQKYTLNSIFLIDVLHRDMQPSG